MISYDDSELPEIAIAPAQYSVPAAMMWVRSHQEPMMRRDGDGHYALIFIAANGSVAIASAEFWGVTDLREAARKMRKWLDENSLIDPEDLEE
jgi:hypothetical protein